MKSKFYFNSILILVLLLSPIFAQSLMAQRKSKKEKNTTEELSEFKIRERTDAFMEGNKQRLLGNFEDSEMSYNKALRADPNHDASMYELARIYRRMKRMDDAIIYAEKAASLDRTNIWYHLLLADLYQNTRQLDKLINAYERLVEISPEKLEFRYDLATAYTFSGDLRSAIKMYDEIENITGISEETAMKKSELWQQLNKPSNALKEIEKLVQNSPGNARYLQILAERYVSENNFDAALKIYQQVVEIQPDDPYIHISLSDLYRKKGDTEKAHNELKIGFANPELDVDSKIQVMVMFYSFDQIFNEQREKAQELSKIMADTHPDDVRALSLYSDLLYRSEEFEPALEVINKILSIDANNYITWEQKMFIENKLSQNENLLETSKNAIELFPMQPLPYLFNGFANYQAKNYQAVARIMERGAKLVVNNNLLLAQFYSTLGDTYNQLKDYPKSDEFYEKALALNPDDVYVLNNYAYYLSLRKTKLERAREMSARSNELQPDKPSFMDTYGWILYQLGEYNEAEIWIKNALEKDDSNSAALLEHYGDVLYKLGQKNEAKKYWKNAAAGEGEKSEFLDQKIKEGTLVE